MLSEHKSAHTVGLVLVVLGALALLGNLGFWGGVGSLFPALLFAAGGFYLLRLSSRDARQLWAVPAGFALFGLALAVISGPLGGSYFLALLAAGFVLVYRQDQSRWWAIIPAGALFTIALVAGLEALLPRADGGPVFLLGLAATFGLVYLREQRWAVYPAIALAVLAVLSASFASSWLLPVLLLAGGVYLLRRKGPAEAQSASESIVPLEPEAPLEERSSQPQV